MLPNNRADAKPKKGERLEDATFDAEFRCMTSKPAKSFEEWLEIGERACVRLSQDEEYRRKMARFLS